MKSIVKTGALISTTIIIAIIINYVQANPIGKYFSLFFVFLHKKFKYSITIKSTVLLLLV